MYWYIFSNIKFVTKLYLFAYLNESEAKKTGSILDGLAQNQQHCVALRRKSLEISYCTL